MYVKAFFSKITKQKSQVKIEFVISSRDANVDLEDFVGFHGFLKFAGKEIVKEIREAMNNKRYAVDVDKKTPSQILRGRLIELWSVKDKERQINPEDFYKTKMEQIIKHFEQKIKTINNG